MADLLQTAAIGIGRLASDIATEGRMLVRLFSNRLGSLPIIPIAPLREQLELRRCGEGSPVTERIWIAIAMVWDVNRPHTFADILTPRSIGRQA